MKSSGKMCLKVLLKVTENQDFILSLEDKFLEKTTGEGGIKWTSYRPPPPPIPPLVVLGLKNFKDNRDAMRNE